MVDQQLPLMGSCLCGAVQVRLDAPALLTLACHCHDCQKLCASAYSLTTVFPSDGFSYTGKLIQGGRGSAQRKHYFCASCLGFVYSQIVGADHRINLRTAILDDAQSFTPFAEMMTDAKLPWANVAAVHSFAQFPESFEVLQSLMAKDTPSMGLT